MDRTRELIERHQAGDPEALSELVERDLAWIRQEVHRRLGQPMRRFGDTNDFVQETVLKVLRFGPRFVLSSREQLRALLAKIVLNVLRSKHREIFALKRDPNREQALGKTSLLLDAVPGHATPPPVAAEKAEEQEWIRLAVLLLPPPDQEVLALHRSGLSDPEIAERLGTTSNTARMRRSRAVARLTMTVRRLKQGRLAEVVAEDSESELDS